MIVSGLPGSGATLIENTFIDHYMAGANGEFVKIYLYLVRFAGSGKELSVPCIADFFEQTEGDVKRALNYWQQAGLLELDADASGEPAAVRLLPVRDPERAGRMSDPDESALSRKASGHPRKASAPPERPSVSPGKEHASMGGPSVLPGKEHTSLNRAAAFPAEASDRPRRAASSPEELSAPSGKAPASLDMASVLPGNEPASSDGASAFPAETSGQLKKASASPEAASDLPAETSSHPYSASASPEETSAPAEEAHQKKQDRQLRRTELGKLFYVAETYFQRDLSSSEMSMLDYFMNDLHMSSDLVEYLLEYCIDKGHTSVRYMEKVAQSWDSRHITTVRQAKEDSKGFGGDYTAIFRELGLNRQPAPAEKKLMDKWLSEYAFPLEIIREACRRTVLQTSQPSLTYADGILSSWHASSVRTMEEIRKLDAEHESGRKTKAGGNASPARQKGAHTGNRLSGGRFSSYSHEDADWNAISRQIMNQKRQES